MKNLFKFSLVLATVLFAFASCDKQKSAVNKLEGSWMVSSTSTDVELETCGATAGEEPDITWTFSSYDVGSESSGTVTMKVDTSEMSSTYSVNEDGDMLTIGSGTGAQMYNLDKVTGSTLELSQTNTVNNITDCNTFETEEVEVTTSWTFDKQ